MFNLNKFISDRITMRSVSLFMADIETNKEELKREIEDKSVCVLVLLLLKPYYCLNHLS